MSEIEAETTEPNARELQRMKCEIPDCQADVVCLHFCRDHHRRICMGQKGIRGDH